MNPYSILLVLVAAAAVAAVITGVALARRPRLQLYATPLCLVALACVLGTTVLSLSWPKPGHLETLRPEEAEVLWARAEPPRRILLLLTWEGSGGPRFYEMPWTQQKEEALRRGEQKARALRRKLAVRHPFGGGPQGEDDPGDGGAPRQGQRGTRAADNEGADEQFYAPMPPPLPEKSGSSNEEEIQ